MAVISIVVACRDKYWNNEHYRNNYFNRFQYQTPAALRSNEISNTAVMRLRIKFNTLSPISFVIKYAKKYSYYFFYDSRALSMLLPLCFIVWKCLKKCWSPRKITLCLENDSIILSKQTREYRNHLYKNYSLEISSLFLNIKPNSKVKDTGENVGIHGKFLLQKLLMWTIKAPGRTVKFSDRFTLSIFVLFHLYFDRREKCQDCSLKRSDTLFGKWKNNLGEFQQRTSN